AGLATAIRLKQLDPQRSVCVLEKAASIGGHSLSGAVLEPAALDALWPEWRKDPPALCQPVTRDELRLLRPRGALPLPVPGSLHNHGNFIVSLGQLLQKLAQHAEGLGVEVLPGFAAASALFDASGA